MLSDRPEKARWPRSQKFTLSPKGREVELAYRETIVAARSDTTGRDSFDAARARWAQQNGLQPDDGLYLGEVASAPVSLPRLVEALETCGKSKPDAVAAIGRLVDAGFVATVAGSPT